MAGGGREGSDGGVVARVVYCLIVGSHPKRKVIVVASSKFPLVKNQRYRTSRTPEVFNKVIGGVDLHTTRTLFPNDRMVVKLPGLLKRKGLNLMVEKSNMSKRTSE